MHNNCQPVHLILPQSHLSDISCGFHLPPRSFPLWQLFAVFTFPRDTFPVRRDNNRETGSSWFSFPPIGSCLWFAGCPTFRGLGWSLWSPVPADYSRGETIRPKRHPFLDERHLASLGWHPDARPPDHYLSSTTFQLRPQTENPAIVKWSFAADLQSPIAGNAVSLHLLPDFKKNPEIFITIQKSLKADFVTNIF